MLVESQRFSSVLIIYVHASLINEKKMDGPKLKAKSNCLAQKATFNTDKKPL